MLVCTASQSSPNLLSCRSSVSSGSARHRFSLGAVLAGGRPNRKRLQRFAEHWRAFATLLLLESLRQGGMQHGVDGFLDGFLDADLEAVTNNRRLSGYETELGGMYHDHRGFEVPGNMHMHNMYGRAVAEAQDDDDRRSFRRGVGSHVEAARSGRRSSEARNAAERFDRVGPQQLAELCERLALERDQAVEEAKEARSARDSALAACAQLASIAPDRRAERDAHQVRELTLTLTLTLILTLTLR